MNAITKYTHCSVSGNLSDPEAKVALVLYNFWETGDIAEGEACIEFEQMELLFLIDELNNYVRPEARERFDEMIKRYYEALNKV